MLDKKQRPQVVQPPPVVPAQAPATGPLRRPQDSLPSATVPTDSDTVEFDDIGLAPEQSRAGLRLPETGTAMPRVPEGTAGFLKTPGFGQWRYVVYRDHVKLARLDMKIGTIPWITNNPGNIMVRTAPHPKGRSHESGLEVRKFEGAYGKGVRNEGSSGKKEERYYDPSKVVTVRGGDKVVRSYATFETREAGETAISDWIREFARIQEAAGQKPPTLEAGARAFVGEHRDVYVATIKERLMKPDIGMTKPDADAFMKKTVSSMTAEDWGLLQQGIKLAEGSETNLDGVIYRGHTTFVTPDFSKAKTLTEVRREAARQEIERLRASSAVQDELDKLFR